MIPVLDTVSSHRGVGKTRPDGFLKVSPCLYRDESEGRYFAFIRYQGKLAKQEREANTLAHVFSFPARRRVAAGYLKLRIPCRSVTFPEMTLTVNIPDELARELGAGFQDIGLAALEALAAEAYARGVLSLEQVRQLLALETCREARELLSRHDVWPGQTADEILEDAETSARFRAALP